MTLLRLLAFEPAAEPSAEAKSPVRAVAREAASTSGPTASSAPASGSRQGAGSNAQVASGSHATSGPPVPAYDAPAQARGAPAPSSAAALAPLQIADWPAFVAGLKLSGIALQLAAQEKRERAEVKAKTEAAFRDDPFVQDLLSRFDATIKTDSIKPNS